MKVLSVAVVLALCSLSALAVDAVPPVPLPMSQSEIAELPHAEAAWEYKWKSHHEFLVVRIVSRADPARTRGFSIIEIRHQTADFSEFALVLPGREPLVDGRVLTVRRELKTESGDGPFFTFIRDPDS